MENKPYLIRSDREKRFYDSDMGAVVDKILIDVVPTLEKDKRMELIGRLSDYLHLDAPMLTGGDAPGYGPKDQRS